MNGSAASTIEVRDDALVALRRMAAVTHRSPEDVAADAIMEHARRLGLTLDRPGVEVSGSTAEWLDRLHKLSSGTFMADGRDQPAMPPDRPDLTSASSFSIPTSASPY